MKRALAAIALAAVVVTASGCTDELPSTAEVTRKIDVAGAAMLVPDACDAIDRGFRVKEEQALLKAEARKLAQALRTAPDETVRTIDGDEYTTRELVARVYDDACPYAQAQMRAAGIQPVKAGG